MASATPRKRRRSRGSEPTPIGSLDVDSGELDAVPETSPLFAADDDGDAEDVHPAVLAEDLSGVRELVRDEAIVETSDVVEDDEIVDETPRIRQPPPPAPVLNEAVSGARRAQLSSGFTPHAIAATDGSVPEAPLRISPPAPRRQASTDEYAITSIGGASPEQMFARRLAVHVVSAIEDSNARKILVTSPNRGDGKSRFVSLIKPEMPVVSTMSYLVLDMSQLVSTDPKLIPDDVLVLVDGPAMLEGDGVLRIPDDWMAALDGSIVVVMGRDTTRSALEDTISYLAASDLPAVGVIFNEAQAPPLRQRLRGLEARFVDPTSRRLRNPFKRRSK